jgi:hypothetical protein
LLPPYCKPGKLAGNATYEIELWGADLERVPTEEEPGEFWEEIEKKEFLPSIVLVSLAVKRSSEERTSLHSWCDEDG